MKTPNHKPKRGWLPRLVRLRRLIDQPYKEGYAAGKASANMDLWCARQNLEVTERCYEANLRELKKLEIRQERLIRMLRQRSLKTGIHKANAEVSDRRAHGNDNTTGANGGSLH